MFNDFDSKVDSPNTLNLGNLDLLAPPSIPIPVTSMSKMKSVTAVNSTSKMSRGSFKIDKSMMTTRQKREFKSAMKSSSDRIFPEQLRKKDEAMLYQRIMNKEDFRYGLKSVVEHVFRCVGFRKKQSLRHHKKLRRHFYFAKGEEKLNNELDVI